jgi:phosphatidylinositol-3-phosphatase
MSLRARALRLAAGIGLLGALVLPGAVSTVAGAGGSAEARLNHVFVIMLENHSFSSVIGNANAPFINSLADRYALAENYFGVTHPSLPNYVAAISGSNWFSNADIPTQTFNHRNLVDQLEENHIRWGAYMETMPSAGFTGTQYPANAALYVNKHNPFILFDDVRNDASRRANIKPYSDLAGDLDSGAAPNFVWITPNQCHDMHGGVFVTVSGESVDGAPCPFGNTKDDANDAALKQKADAFVHGAVDTIMSSKAWTGNSAIFIVTDENDFNSANPDIDNWDSAAGCCDSPVLPDGYRFQGSSGAYDGNVLDCPGDAKQCTYGGGQIPAVIVTTHGARGYTSDQPYNHYSLLRTIEENWNLGYLENASDSTQVHSMKEFLTH